MIFQDLDGCAVDFCGGVAKLFGKTPEWLYANWQIGTVDICKALNINKSQLWSRVNSTDNFWETLEPYPWLDELIKVWGDNKVHICTSPGVCDAKSVHGKAKWINKYLGSRFNRNFIFTPNKYLLAGPGRILIDDNDLQCKSFAIFGGEICLFPAKWNDNHHNDHRKIDYVKERLEEIQLKCFGDNNV